MPKLKSSAYFRADKKKSTRKITNEVYLLVS